MEAYPQKLRDLAVCPSDQTTPSNWHNALHEATNSAISPDD